MQQRHRAVFKAAVEAWQSLSDRQQEFYDRIAVGMSGFNVFVSRYVKAVTDGQKPEVPLVIRWTVRNRKLPKGAWFGGLPGLLLLALPQGSLLTQLTIAVVYVAALIPAGILLSRQLGESAKAFIP